MITVLGRAGSLNVQLVMWGIVELDLPNERLDYGMQFGGNDTPEYLAMNPNGLVPTLRDGELALFESCAILRYLASRYGGAPFWPEDAVARAPIDVWVEWGKTTLQRDFAAPVFWKRIRTPAAERDETAYAAALKTFEGHLDILETRLADGRPFVMGTDLTLADIVIGHLLYRYFTLDIARPERLALAAYYARLTERPAYQEHVMVPWDSLRVSGA
jgi:glutathione S-transferase